MIIGLVQLVAAHFGRGDLSPVEQGDRSLMVQFFTLPQIFGYIAFVLGVFAFQQKRDRTLKLLVGLDSLTYAVHFFLLGNLPASGSAVITSIRSFLAMKTRSLTVAFIVITANVCIGFALTRTGLGWLPVIGSSISTYAVFTMQGIAMRIVMLVSTCCWLTNNILCGSIGGTFLEITIAIVNISTIARLIRSRKKIEEPA
jgi:hypothetical protein